MWKRGSWWSRRKGYTLDAKGVTKTISTHGTGVMGTVGSLVRVTFVGTPVELSKRDSELRSRCSTLSCIDKLLP